MIPTSQRWYLYEAFGPQAARFVGEAGLAYAPEREGDFHHLSVPARGSAGLGIQLNVGWQEASLTLGRQALLTPRRAAVGACLGDDLLTLVRQLAGGASNFRRPRRARAPGRWRRAMGGEGGW